MEGGELTEWNVILVIGEVIALFLLIGKPLLNLNTTLTELKSLVNSLLSDFNGFKATASETHKEFNEHLEEHDIKLENHELRIQSLEHKN